MDIAHKVVVLDISSYVGMSIGASHTYGKLVHQMGDKTKRVTVERPMTAADAARENKKDRREGSLENINKPGNITSRLKDEDDVIKTALEMWQGHFPYAQVLLVRREYTSSPGKIIASPDEKRALQINSLWVDYLQAEDEGFSDDEIIEISGEWRREFNNYLATLPDIEYVPDEIADEYNWSMAESLLLEAENRKAEEERRERYQREEDRRHAVRAAELQEWYDTAEFDEIEITVKASTTFAKKEDGYERGIVTFFMACADVYNDDETEKIGSVRSGVDASVWLRHKSYKHMYRIRTDDLWYAFMEALDARQEGNGRPSETN